jgi:hypothetical protein
VYLHPFQRSALESKLQTAKKQKDKYQKNKKKKICVYCKFAAFMENLLAKGTHFHDKFVLCLHLAHKTVVCITARFFVLKS